MGSPLILRRAPSALESCAPPSKLGGDDAQLQSRRTSIRVRSSSVGAGPWKSTRQSYKAFRFSATAQRPGHHPPHPAARRRVCKKRKGSELLRATAAATGHPGSWPASHRSAPCLLCPVSESGSSGESSDAVRVAQDGRDDRTARHRPLAVASIPLIDILPSARKPKLESVFRYAMKGCTKRMAPCRATGAGKSRLRSSSPDERWTVLPVIDPDGQPWIIVTSAASQAGEWL